ncbi:PA0069 family radical SAM protein [Litoreibacter roseus]|uniref:Radical SAM protein n=1 Tax=Litoreibacter roseus TaxID=2601869 RepID=A0A6N6JDC3_9RHOB|nr:PA0069 family radical SAM protein [Litoreibacter roseus]GFE64124.1 radical SAM protein [Litoreibacter roseus]
MESDPNIRHGQRKGRAASSNVTNRFERLKSVGVDDGWGREEEWPVLRTEVSTERPRSVIARNTSPDIGFDRSLNPYRGCEHGCIYCFARPGHAYLGMSPGLDFETRLIAKAGAADVLRKELSAKNYKPDVLAIGTYTDAYQPIEKRHQIIRGVLQVLSDFNHPVGLVTKGNLIERDIDILAPMAAKGLAHVSISVTTLDRDLARKMEPRVPSPERRLKTIERLVSAGVPVRVSASPMIPGLTDHELEAILARARDVGASSATSIALRLPREVSDLFQDWLAEHIPDRAARVMARVREMHGGKPYDANFGTRMTGTGVYAKLLRDRFYRATQSLGLRTGAISLRTDLFSVPPKTGDQLSLF